jgi:hypothetical protein
MYNGVVPPYNNPDLVDQRNQEIVEINSKLYLIYNRAFGLDYTEEFWLFTLNDYFKTCYNRKQFLSNETYKHKFFFLPKNSRELVGIKERALSFVKYILMSVYIGCSKKMFARFISSNNNEISVGGRAKRLEHEGYGTALPFYFPLNLFAVDNLKSRKKLIKSSYVVEDIFLQNILRETPYFYFMAISFLNTLISRGLYTPEKIYYEHVRSPFEYFLMAYCQMKGTQVIHCQPGGFFGEVSFNPSFLVYQTHQSVLTYGWKSCAKDIPGKAFRLYDYADIYNAEREKVTGPSSQVFLPLSLADEYTKPHYIKLYEHLKQRLDKKAYSGILLRPRPLSKYINNTKLIGYLNIDERTIVDNGMSSPAVSAARCCITIQPQLPTTNFLESIFVDQPTVAIDTNNAPSHHVKKYYEALHRLKVLHKDEVSLVDHLNTINIENWWSTVTKDSEFIEFRKKHAGKS